MINVLHILSDLNVGGAGKWLINACTYMDKKKINMVVCLPKGSLVSPYLEAINVKVYEVSNLHNSIDTKSIKEIKKVIKEESIQIVHTHASLSGRIAGILNGCKVIYTRHCMGEGDVPYIKRVINNFLCHRAIAISSAVADNLLKNGIEKHKIILIYNGIPKLKTLSRDEKSKMKDMLLIEEDAFVYGCVGRLSYEKGQDILIKAFSALSKKYEHIRLIIVGSGPMEKELKTLCRQEDLFDKVIFTGYTDDVDSYINLFDVNVIPSREEAFSLSACEAMSLHVPVIATDSGGIREVVLHEKTGLLCKIEVEDLCRNMEYILNNYTAREIFKIEGFNHYSKNFTVEKMVAKLILLYEELGE